MPSSQGWHRRRAAPHEPDRPTLSSLSVARCFVPGRVAHSNLSPHPNQGASLTVNRHAALHAPRAELTLATALSSIVATVVPLRPTLNLHADPHPHPLHRHRSPLTAHLSPFTLTLSHQSGPETARRRSSSLIAARSRPPTRDSSRRTERALGTAMCYIGVNNKKLWSLDQPFYRESKKEKKIPLN